MQRVINFIYVCMYMYENVVPYFFVIDNEVVRLHDAV